MTEYFTAPESYTRADCICEIRDTAGPTVRIYENPDCPVEDHGEELPEVRSDWTTGKASVAIRILGHHFDEESEVEISRSMALKALRMLRSMMGTRSDEVDEIAARHPDHPIHDEKDTRFRYGPPSDNLVGLMDQYRGVMGDGDRGLHDVLAQAADEIERLRGKLDRSDHDTTCPGCGSEGHRKDCTAFVYECPNDDCFVLDFYR